MSQNLRNPLKLRCLQSRRGFWLTTTPLPQARAQTIFSELVRAEGWDQKAEKKIVAFGAWLASRPPPSALKPKCEELLAAIES